MALFDFISNIIMSLVSIQEENQCFTFVKLSTLNHY